MASVLLLQIIGHDFEWAFSVPIANRTGTRKCEGTGPTGLQPLIRERLSGGSLKTLEIAIKQRKPHLHVSANASKDHPGSSKNMD